jgi:hypothetical protein
VAALLEEDEVTLMLAPHHVGEARRLLAERLRSRGMDASEVGQRLRSVEAFLAIVEQHLSALATACPAFRSLARLPGRSFFIVRRADCRRYSMPQRS